MLIILFITILTATNLYAQWTDTTSVIMLKFSEPMKIEGLLNPDNYQVKTFGENKFWQIYNVGLVNSYRDSSGNVIQGDSSSIVLVVEKLPYKKTYEITANNVEDKAGNIINPEGKKILYYFNGYAPEKFPNNTVNFDK